jgi:hypothetical protein
MVKEFKDLVFEEQGHGGLGSSTKIGEHTLSVQCGKFVYSSPREDASVTTSFSSFEVAVIDSDGDFVTEKFIDDSEEGGVAGWVTRDTINQVINQLTNKK